MLYRGDESRIVKCVISDIRREVEKNCALPGYYVASSCNLFAEYNQQDGKFRKLFISVRRSTCFRRFFRPSSGPQNYTYSVRYLSDQYCYLLLAVMV